MNKQQLNNALHVGGTIETALSGDYQLSAASVIEEATKLTHKHFWRFLPATAMFFLAHLTIVLIVLSVMLDSPMQLIEALLGKREMTGDMVSSAQIASFLSSVLSAPLYAGASLMGLSHAIGFRTKPRHIIKGLAYGIAVTVAMCIMTMLQSVANSLFVFLGLYLGIAFSMTILLICEKRLRPLQAMMTSLRAINKKLLPLTAVYIVIAVLFLFSLATAGLALIWTLPFMFNVKGVIYRDMFGVGIEVTVLQEGDDDSDLSGGSGDGKNEVFHA